MWLGTVAHCRSMHGSVSSPPSASVPRALTLATLSERNGDSGPIGAAGRVAHRVVQPVTDAADSVFSPIHDWWHGFWHHGDVVVRRGHPARDGGDGER